MYFSSYLLAALVYAGLEPPRPDVNPRPPPRPPPPAVPPASIPLDEWNVRFETRISTATMHIMDRPSRRNRGLHACCSAPTRSTTTRIPATYAPRPRLLPQFRHATSSSGATTWNTTPKTKRASSTTCVGETMPRIIARPGVLTGNAPFHFEGQWAERVGEKYILYNGWVTNCTNARPVVATAGRQRFDIIPGPALPSPTRAGSCSGSSRCSTRRSSTTRSKRSLARAAS